MKKYKIGDLVTVYFGQIPMIGTVVYLSKENGKYLVRFNGTQQMYYSEDELIPYDKSISS